MACKKPPKGAKHETFFPQSQKDTTRPDPQAKYEAEKIAALVSQFSSKPDPSETT